MPRRQDDFDDNEGFFASLTRREDSVPMPHSMRRLFKAGIVGGVLLIIGLVTWAVWPSNNGQSDVVPVIHADKSAYKVEPEDKGGMPIPNENSTVFEAIGDNSAPRNVENLLEDEEMPMKKDDVFTEEPVAKIEPEEVVEEPKDTVEEKVKEENREEVPVAVTPPKQEKLTSATPKKNIIDTLKAETSSPKKEVVTGSTYIQLAAVRSEADARAKWSKLQGSYSVLKSFSLRVKRVDLGAKGIFFRVQAGPMSASSAASTCAKVKAAGGDCLVVK